MATANLWIVGDFKIYTKHPITDVVLSPLGPAGGAFCNSFTAVFIPIRVARHQWQTLKT